MNVYTVTWTNLHGRCPCLHVHTERIKPTDFC